MWGPFYTISMSKRPLGYSGRSQAVLAIGDMWCSLHWSGKYWDNLIQALLWERETLWGNGEGLSPFGTEEFVIIIWVKSDCIWYLGQWSNVSTLLISFKFFRILHVYIFCWIWGRPGSNRTTLEPLRKQQMLVYVNLICNSPWDPSAFYSCILGNVTAVDHSVEKQTSPWIFFLQGSILNLTLPGSHMLSLKPPGAGR